MGVQAAALLGSFLAEHEDRIAKRAGKALKHELDEAPSREHRKNAVPSYVGELASFLLERGAEAPRLWGEAVRHHGGAHFDARHDLGDLIREFKSLSAAIVDEWDRRVGPMPADVAVLLSDCVAEGAAAAVSDFVRRLRGEQADFRESALIETILAHLDEGILLLEADGTLSFATKPAYRLLGPGLDSLLGRPINDPAVDELLGEIRATTLDGKPIRQEDLPGWRALKSGRGQEALLVRVERGGEQRVLEYGAIPIWSDEAETGAAPALRGVITTVRDRTVDIRKSEELRNANRELAELHTRVLHRSRAQAMGELAAGAAHALNNLLNAMHLRLRLLREAPGPEQVDSLGRSVNDIAALVARLQQFVSQRPAGPVEPCAIDAIVKEALALVRPEGQRAGEGVVHVKALMHCASDVRANLGELREILVSLLLYAREQLAAGGELEVRTQQQDDGAELHIVLRPAAPLAHPRAEELFEPFTGPEAAASLSLAASSAREALSRWGGGLQARSLDGGGAEFVLRFAPAQPRKAPAEPLAPAATGGKHKVLVVDDDPDNASMLAEVLDTEGIPAETASTAQEALAKWQSGGFDVALVDLLMPDMPGTDLAKAFLSSRPDARVALVTGWELDDDQRRAAPVHAVFRKPVDIGQLLGFLGQPAPAPAQV